MKKILLFVLVLTNCSHPIYNNTYHINDDISRHDSLIIFSEDLHGIKLTNIANHNNVDFTKSSTSNLYTHDDFNIIKVQSGRYIFSEGFD